MIVLGAVQLTLNCSINIILNFILFGDMNVTHSGLINVNSYRSRSTFHNHLLLEKGVGENQEKQRNLGDGASLPKVIHVVHIDLDACILRRHQGYFLVVYVGLAS